MVRPYYVGAWIQQLLEENPKLTARQLADLTGRSLASVKVMRTKAKQRIKRDQILRQCDNESGP